MNTPVLKGSELHRLKSKTQNYPEEGSASSQAQPQKHDAPCLPEGVHWATQLSKNILSRKE